MCGVGSDGAVTQADIHRLCRPSSITAATTMATTRPTTWEISQAARATTKARSKGRARRNLHQATKAQAKEDSLAPEAAAGGEAQPS